MLELTNNSFNNEIPLEIGHLRRLQMLYIYLSWNRLVGKIPEEIGSLLKLQYLFIHANSLYGGIPQSFGNLSSLERLSATQNNIVGIIPDSLIIRAENSDTYVIGENRPSQ